MHGGERGGGKGRRGSDSPAKRGRSRAHTSTLASALRIRTPHSVEILAIDGATTPDDVHALLSRPPCVFVHRILLKSTQGKGVTT